MSRLTEKYIQTKAIEYLEDYYQEKYSIEKDDFFSRDEVKTTKHYFNNRADGLLCFNSDKQNQHTVSIEAKSHKTLGSLLTFWNDERLGLHGIFVAIILGLASIFFYYHLAWYWISLIALATIVVMMFLFILIITVIEPHHYKLINVVTQVHQYPANEKWIALSKDSLNLAKEKKSERFRRKTDYDNFIRICKAQGIGILIVTRRKIIIMVKPKFVNGNYLECYAQHKNISSYIASSNL